jgi:magnesium-transporting ATPase (P-type)
MSSDTVIVIVLLVLFIAFSVWRHLRQLREERWNNDSGWLGVVFFMLAILTFSFFDNFFSSAPKWLSTLLGLAFGAVAIFLQTKRKT